METPLKGISSKEECSGDNIQGKLYEDPILGYFLTRGMFRGLEPNILTFHRLARRQIKVPRERRDFHGSNIEYDPDV